MAPSTEILIDRLKALLGRDAESLITAKTSAQSARQRMLETRLLLEGTPEAMHILTRYLYSITMSFPQQMEVSEIKIDGERAWAAPPELKDRFFYRKS